MLAAALAGCGGSGGDGSRPAEGRSAAQAYQRVLDDGREHGAVGVTAAIVHRGRLLWSGGSGVADQQTRRPLGGDSVLALASVTKTFVAALALRLAEDDVLRLDDPVAKWLPRAGLSPKVTLRRMLNHTSGLFGVDEDPAYLRAVDRLADRRRRWTPAQTLRYVGRPYFAPGEGWHYSDTGYVLAGLAIERATGSSVAAELDRRVLAPLELRSAGLQPQDAPPADAAHGYGDPQRTGTIRDLSRGMRWVPYDSLASSEWTSGGMFATAEDVARFGDALFSGRLIDSAAIEEMTDWQQAAFASYIGYGLGVGKRFDPELGGALWGSIGRVAGFNADLWYVPSRRLAVAVLANDERADTTDVADALLREARTSR